MLPTLGTRPSTQSAESADDSSWGLASGQMALGLGSSHERQGQQRSEHQASVLCGLCALCM